ncbi:hypothetical protein L596_002201 [Steinernema carpocapsae]|uniref:Uncharacterized protein n=1 Tax=Steinernema carpocapsae TaxID=34508 RepID=A0A4U8UR73_STECR|nr:hypothetical protein L596_002201 [Steinernema carpocapsae]
MSLVTCCHNAYHHLPATSERCTFSRRAGKIVGALIINRRFSAGRRTHLHSRLATYALLAFQPSEETPRSKRRFSLDLVRVCDRCTRSLLLPSSSSVWEWPPLSRSSRAKESPAGSSCLKPSASAHSRGCPSPALKATLSQKPSEPTRSSSGT